MERSGYWIRSKQVEGCCLNYIRTIGVPCRFISFLFLLEAISFLFSVRQAIFKVYYSTVGRSRLQRKYKREDGKNGRLKNSGEGAKGTNVQLKIQAEEKQASTESVVVMK